MRDIGKNIKQLRIQKNMTQDQLAEQLFVTRQTVSNYETGKSRPDIDMLMKIAEVLEVDIHTILYGPAPKPDRKEELIRLAVAGSISIVFGALLVFLQGWVDKQQVLHYNLTPTYLFALVYVPVYYLVLGWTMMQGLGILLKAKPLRHPITPYIRRGLLVLFVLYFIVMMPFLWHIVYDGIMLRQAQEAGVAYSSSFSLPPVWKELNFWLTYTLANYPLIPIPLGAALWLCGFPVKKSQ